MRMITLADAPDYVAYAVEGSGALAFVESSLAFFRDDEEFRLSNASTTGLTVLAFLAPAFLPPST